MLKDNLYHIEQIQKEEQEVVAQIQLNANHDIFNGHFPGVPVLPGVTMMQMVKEILEEAFAKNLLIKRAGQLKFLQMINPQDISQLTFNIKWSDTEEGYKVNAILKQQEQVFFKMTGLLA